MKDREKHLTLKPQSKYWKRVLRWPVDSTDAETWINGDDAIIQGFATQAFESEVKAEVNSAGNAIRQVDNLLAKSGLPRNERRELLNQIKGSTQDAAPKGTQDAALSDLAFRAELFSLNLQLSSM